MDTPDIELGPILPPARTLAILGIGAILIAILINQAAGPVRHALANRYLARGDAAFLSEKYDKANREYKKALHYNPVLTEAETNEVYAAEAPTDIAKARPFFEEHQAIDVLKKLDKATAPYDDPKEALKVGVEFFKAGAFVYARYPIERAVQLDSQYPEALHYLSQTYEKLAEFDASFRDKALDAARRRDAITPNYLKGTGTGVE